MTKRERIRFAARHPELDGVFLERAITAETIRRFNLARPPVKVVKPARKAVPYQGSVRQKLNSMKPSARKRVVSHLPAMKRSAPPKGPSLCARLGIPHY